VLVGLPSLLQSTATATAFRCGGDVQVVDDTITIHIGWVAFDLFADALAQGF